MPGLPKVTGQPKVIDLAKQLGTTPSQLGLAWLLRHRANMLLIPGTTDLGHLEENVGSGSVVLGEETMTALDALTAAPS